MGRGYRKTGEGEEEARQVKEETGATAGNLGGRRRHAACFRLWIWTGGRLREWDEYRTGWIMHTGMVVLS